MGKTKVYTCKMSIKKTRKKTNRRELDLRDRSFIVIDDSIFERMNSQELQERLLHNTEKQSAFQVSSNSFDFMITNPKERAVKRARETIVERLKRIIKGEKATPCLLPEKEN